MNEKSVALLWKSGGYSCLWDDMGNRVEVVCVGRESTTTGCDFQDVVLNVNGKKVTGDIEIHVTSDMWQKHRHHLNPAYNGIVLHVVMWRKGSLPVRCQSGDPVPTVTLGDRVTRKHLSRQSPCSGSVSCRLLPSIGNGDIAEILRQAGERRFDLRCRAYALSLQQEEPEQVLFKGICRALGYSRNVGPFERLAGQLSLRTIYDRGEASLSRKLAVILGSAGLLPSQRQLLSERSADAAEARLETDWIGSGVTCLAMAPTDWHFAGVRPANHPVRRLVALSYLLHRYEKRGLLSALSHCVRECHEAVGTSVLEGALCVRGNRYWRTHTDFGISYPQEISLLAAGRAREVVVNVVLPFF
jgi:hypothetical protein